MGDGHFPPPRRCSLQGQKLRTQDDAFGKIEAQPPSSLLFVSLHSFKTVNSLLFASYAKSSGTLVRKSKGLGKYWFSKLITQLTQASILERGRWDPGVGDPLCLGMFLGRGWGEFRRGETHFWLACQRKEGQRRWKNLLKKESLPCLWTLKIRTKIDYLSERCGWKMNEYIQKQMDGVINDFPQVIA